MNSFLRHPYTRPPARPAPACAAILGDLLIAGFLPDRSDAPNDPMRGKIQ